MEEIRHFAVHDLVVSHPVCYLASSIGNRFLIPVPKKAGWLAGRLLKG